MEFLMTSLDAWRKSEKSSKVEECNLNELDKKKVTCIRTSKVKIDKKDFIYMLPLVTYTIKYYQ